MIAAILAKINQYALLIGCIAAFAAGWQINGWRLDGKAEAAVKAKETEVAKACRAVQQTSEEINNAYQAKIADINRRLAESRRVSSMCVAISSESAGSASRGTGHAGQNGISSDWLREYAAECNTYRAQRIELESMDKEIRKALTQ